MTAIQTVARPASGNSTGSPRAGLKKRTVESFCTGVPVMRCLKIC
jgi:hypothetical protein